MCTIHEHCDCQGHALFLILWNCIIPLSVFVFAYSMIFIVVRRQAKVAAGDRQTTTGTVNNQPVAGMSHGMTEVSVEPTASSLVRAQGNKGAITAGSEGRRRDNGQSSSTTLTHAKINVIKTMIYIIIYVAFCSMPTNVYLTIKRFTVM